MVKARWAARPRPGLPDAREWSATLALAVIQTLLGQRPVAQLNRWMVEEVLAAISICQRRSLSLHGRTRRPHRTALGPRPAPRSGGGRGVGACGDREAISRNGVSVGSPGRPLAVHCPGARPGSVGCARTSRVGVRLSHDRRLD